jgi:hypothetical protein
MGMGIIIIMLLFIMVITIIVETIITLATGTTVGSLQDIMDMVTITKIGIPIITTALLTGIFTRSRLLR